MTATTREAGMSIAAILQPFLNGTTLSADSALESILRAGRLPDEIADALGLVLGGRAGTAAQDAVFSFVHEALPDPETFRFVLGQTMVVLGPEEATAYAELLVRHSDELAFLVPVLDLRVLDAVLDRIGQLPAPVQTSVAGAAAQMYFPSAASLGARDLVERQNATQARLSESLVSAAFRACLDALSSEGSCGARLLRHLLFETPPPSSDELVRYADEGLRRSTVSSLGQPPTDPYSDSPTAGPRAAVHVGVFVVHPVLLPAYIALLTSLAADPSLDPLARGDAAAAAEHLRAYAKRTATRQRFA